MNKLTSISSYFMLLKVQGKITNKSSPNWSINIVNMHTTWRNKFQVFACNCIKQKAWEHMGLGFRVWTLKALKDKCKALITASHNAHLGECNSHYCSCAQSKKMEENGKKTFLKLQWLQKLNLPPKSINKPSSK